MVSPRCAVAKVSSWYLCADEGPAVCVALWSFQTFCPHFKALWGFMIRLFGSRLLNFQNLKVAFSLSATFGFYCGYFLLYLYLGMSMLTHVIN